MAGWRGCICRGTVTDRGSWTMLECQSMIEGHFSFFYCNFVTECYLFIHCMHTPLSLWLSVVQFAVTSSNKHYRRQLQAKYRRTKIEEVPALKSTDYSSIPGPGPPCLPICLALSISSHRRRFDAIPELDAIAFLSTRKESYTPSRTGSMGSPVFRSRPKMLPSVCWSWRVATTRMSEV